MNQQYRNDRGRQQGAHQPSAPQIDTSKIDLKEIKPDLFDQVALNTAKTIATDGNSNKPTQLRKFYDEIVMWEHKCSMHPDKFNVYLPFIRMLNAKVAYAKGRKLVDDRYAAMLSHCLQQVESVKTMRTFKLFMEAFMGFYKQERPKD